MFTVLMISDAFLFSLTFLFIEKMEKKNPNLFMSILNWHRRIGFKHRTSNLHSKLVACEATAGYGILPQHLSAVAVKGPDHLQQHAAHDDGP